MMTKLCVGALIFGSLLAAVAIGVDLQSYENYKLYHVQPASHAQLKLLVESNNNEQIDLWSSPGIGRRSSVMVDPDTEESFVAMLTLNNISHRVLNDDVQQLIEQERAGQQAKLRARREASDGKDFDRFWTLEEIYQYLDELAETYPDLVRVTSYGTTHQGRPIKVITISTQGAVNMLRPVVLIDGGIHAREWAGHMSVIYLIHQLVENSAEHEDLLKNTDWVIMPVANPDGYVYTHGTNRLWRKNRVPVNTLCQGVDLNRNFPFRWEYYGGECSIGYAGATPASELETRAVMLLMAKYAKVTKVYLAVHTCGDYILYPYGYDYVIAPNAVQLQALGERAARAVEAVGGPEYKVGSAAFLLYPANGSDDFIYGSFGVNYAYTLELSCGEAGGGFIVNNTEIRKIAKEAFEMFKTFGLFAGEEFVPLSEE
ncbi:carboxypeptidase B-like [Malaya genurostris]|uniref:carboxypeptidase B-like n=1 Tax=Malaya genurostris TaxID=325434 RepID=UPI0026F3A86F|nr:carboxypeptidase B-like [Malaya genurostris]XP_058460660.1 carboxypeptidase B-like [Malaya genurostris]XP_058460661.1 carboxypeptidase B-like [Malaya genurostris]XP_058460662.1 carboxypeptidase B-like [Malaya genurostris]XP_058460664.1 carboxypeptidase B-like [Malaya genurostris]